MQANLKKACATEDKVFVARKFCIEKIKGKYFCVKEGRCLGTLCKGCLR